MQQHVAQQRGGTRATPERQWRTTSGQPRCTEQGYFKAGFRAGSYASPSARRGLQRTRAVGFLVNLKWARFGGNERGQRRVVAEVPAGS